MDDLCKAHVTTVRGDIKCLCLYITAPIWRHPFVVIRIELCISTFRLHR